MIQSDFHITLEYLTRHGACLNGLHDFKKAFPDGAGYQEVLDRCADEGRLDYGLWLLNELGPTNETRTYEDALNEPEKQIIFAGSLKFCLSISVKHIIAGEGIKAGGYIKAGEGIEAGKDFGIYAGLRIKLSLWSQFATVSAQSKPDNLISGFWKELP